jgi:hypothetical protein
VPHVRLPSPEPQDLTGHRRPEPNLLPHHRPAASVSSHPQNLTQRVPLVSLVPKVTTAPFFGGRSAVGERATTTARVAGAVTTVGSCAAAPTGMGQPVQFLLLGWASVVWPWANYFFLKLFICLNILEICSNL